MEQRRLAMGVALVGVLGLVAVPAAIVVHRRLQLNKVLADVDDLRRAELHHRDTFGDFVAADPAPRPPYAVDATSVPWRSNEGFTRLGWRPLYPEVHATYRVTLTAKGFVASAACDLDGDGERARVEATESSAATWLTRGVR